MIETPGGEGEENWGAGLRYQGPLPVDYSKNLDFKSIFAAPSPPNFRFKFEALVWVS